MDLQQIHQTHLKNIFGNFLMWKLHLCRWHRWSSFRSTGRQEEQREWERKREREREIERGRARERVRVREREGARERESESERKRERERERERERMCYVDSVRVWESVQKRLKKKKKTREESLNINSLWTIHRAQNTSPANRVQFAFKL